MVVVGQGVVVDGAKQQRLIEQLLIEHAIVPGFAFAKNGAGQKKELQVHGVVVGTPVVVVAGVVVGHGVNVGQGVVVGGGVVVITAQQTDVLHAFFCFP